MSASDPGKAIGCGVIADECTWASSSNFNLFPLILTSNLKTLHKLGPQRDAIAWCI